MRRTPRKVVHLGGHDPTYTRSRVTVKALRRRGIDVVDCTSRVRPRPLRLLLLALAYARAAAGTDVLLVSGGGQAYVPLARILATLTRTPLVFDAFYSQYDVVIEMARAREGSLTARYWYWMDRLSAKLADMVLVDTEHTADYFAAVLGASRSRLRTFPIGSDDEWFRPAPLRVRAAGRPFVVFLPVTFYPLHGVEHVLRAAKLFEDRTEIALLIVGDGPLRGAMVELAGELGLRNTTFLGWVPPAELPGLIAGADLCLGQFGNTPMARMVVPAKVFDALAMARPVLTADHPAVRETFVDGLHLRLCRPEDPAAIRDAVVALSEDEALCTRLATDGYRLFAERFSLEPIGARLVELLAEAMDRT